MIKRTLFFGNPCSLRMKNSQLQVKYPDGNIKTVPVEDVGMLVLDNMQITISQALIAALMDNNAALLTTCNRHLPEGLMLPMAGHHAFTEKVKQQLAASEPLKKNLWQQTIKAKIQNQAELIRLLGADVENMLEWADSVRSGDPDNYESRAAVYYWSQMFMTNRRFKRGRFEEPPNNLLNYGYAILRAVVARSLVGSGMVCFDGIHHSNKYNPFCLADDIMEPYRPWVDKIVLEIVSETESHTEIEELSPELKSRLLQVPVADIHIEGQKSPLMVGVQRTTASLAKCYAGEQRKLLCPELIL